MALDFGSMISSASPLSSAGLDPDELLASGQDPREILARVRSGAAPLATVNPQVSATIPAVSPAAAAVPSRSPSVTSPTPATASAADANRAVPGSVTPSGKPSQWSELARQSLQSGMGAANAAGESLEDVQRLEQQRQQYATPAPAYDPQTGKLLDQYKPTVGQRIVRGVQNFVTGGIPGVIAPGRTGGTPYNAPNRQYQVQDQMRQQKLGNIDQQIAQEQGVEKEQQGLAGTYGNTVKDIAPVAKATSIPPAVIEQAAKAGMKVQQDPDSGQLSFAPDPDSEAYKQAEVMSSLRQSQQEYADAKTALAKAQNDPNSPAYKLAIQRAETARTNAAAATERAQAYYGNYLQGAFNTDLHGGTLPAAPQISNESGDQTTVGSRNANTAIKSNAGAAQFNDVHRSLDDLEQKAAAVHAKGEDIADPLVASALAQPKGTASKWLQGQIAKSNLSPEKRAFVISEVALYENLQALRKSAGGSVSDSQVDRLEAMAPNASTPDLGYLNQQIAQIRAQANTLGKGAATAAGGLHIRGQQSGGNAPKRPDGVPSDAVWNQQGNNGKGSWQIPQHQ